uniref:Solute carrier family 5 member 8 n=1 Tax=Maylandia zebra TaxID=106582 RepID=A0A3P9CQW7_9CICH
VPGCGRLLSDYAVFVLMLLVSATIGLHYAWIGRRQQNTQEFLTGDRKLTALPVSLSLTASDLSSIILISIPVEVMCGIGLRLKFSHCTFIFSLTVFSTKYLELRYNKVTRLLVTFLAIIQTLLLSGLAIYAPALALNQVTGWNLWVVIVVTGMVCTAYSALGGMKAVVWTDVFQVYGFPSFDLNPLRRHTFWTIAIGGTLGWTMTSGTSQTQVQRYNSCKSITHARIYSLFLGSAVFSGFTSGSACGFTSNNYPGLPGLFLAAVYSGTLSTVSSIINTLAAVTLEDLIKPNVTLTDRQLLYISRALSTIGGLCVSMAGSRRSLAVGVQSVLPTRVYSLKSLFDQDVSAITDYQTFNTISQRAQNKYTWCSKCKHSVICRNDPNPRTKSTSLSDIHQPQHKKEVL